MLKNLLIPAALLIAPTLASAQVSVRVPFVRVEVGNGVYVRAPFVNLYVPGGPPVYYGPPAYIGPPPALVPQNEVVPVPPVPQNEVLPVPPINPPKQMPKADDLAPPAPLQEARIQTIEEFAKAFQAKAGTYEVTLRNPLNGQPTVVRFTLPEGTPRRVDVDRRNIEFFYGLRHFVRIEFDQDGAQVISRGFNR